MDYRKLFLRFALLTLVVTGVVGGVLVVIGVGSDIERVIGTGVAAAVAAGLVYPVLAWIDQPRLRFVGIFAAASIVVTLLLVLSAIWAPALLFPSGGGSRLEEGLAATSAVFFACAAPSTLLLRWKHTAPMKYASPAGVIGIGLIFIVSMIDGWISPGGSFDAVVFSSVLLAVVSTVCFINLGQDKRHWRWVGVGAGAVCLLLGVMAWQRMGGHIVDTLMQFCAAGAITVAYCNLMMAFRLKGRVSTLRLVCVLLGAITGGLGIGVIAAESDHFAGAPNEILIRLFAALGLATSCSTLALVVVHRMTVRRPRATGEELPIKTTMLCPRCDRRQLIPFGESRCIGCGVMLFASAYDVVCPSCGYDTGGLTEPRCPECSTRLLLRT